MLGASPDLEEPRIAALVAQGLALSKRSRSANTLRAYRSDCNQFMRFCKQHGASALPASPETVVAYLVYLKARVAFSTLRRRCAGIDFLHRQSGFTRPTTDDTVRNVLQAIMRESGESTRAKRALVKPLLQMVIATMHRDGLRPLRDRALLLLGFAGAFRRAELCALQVSDIEYVPGGMLVHVRRSKTDQQARGIVKEVPRVLDSPLCPVRALEDWRSAAQIHSGPIFRSFSLHGELHDHAVTGHDVARIVKFWCARAGMDPACFAGHSLRRGFITEVARAGASIAEIRKVTYQSDRTVLRYIEASGVLEDPPLLRILG